MTETGRLVAFYGAGEPMRIEEYAVPQPEPGAIVVRTTLANVCGSDLHVWRGDQDLKKMGRALPRHMGHEQCGRVHAMGEGVTADSAGRRDTGESPRTWRCSPRRWAPASPSPRS